MLNLPDAVADFLCSSQIERRSPAYLLSNERGILLDWGGNTIVYGIENLSRGELIEPQLSILAGVIPFTGSPSCIRFVRFGSVTADVHLFSSAEGDWVVLLDVGQEAEQIRSIQQEKYKLQSSLESHPKESFIELGQLDKLKLLLEERDLELRKALGAIERAAEVLRQMVNRGPGR
jgi:hypothetical protein